MSNSDDDNVVYLNNRLKFSEDPVPILCELAGQVLKDVVIMGEAEDGSIKMMTTQPDPAEILFYLESAKFAIMAGGGLDDGE